MEQPAQHVDFSSAGFLQSAQIGAASTGSRICLGRHKFSTVCNKRREGPGGICLSDDRGHIVALLKMAVRRLANFRVVRELLQHATVV